jgi:cystathionine beta-lyase
LTVSRKDYFCAKLAAMNFDKIIDRGGRASIKTGRCKALFGTDDVIPMWVADMEFKSPSCVLEAIAETLDYGLLGYHEPMDAYYDAIIKWQKEHHGMEVKRSWINSTPGVVTGLAIAINAFSEQGDSVVVQTPVYYPFFEYPKRNNRKVAYNPLIEVDGSYVMDYDDLEQHFAAGAKVLILCSPHNPAGRVWRRDELLKVSELAEKYGVVVLADEIHGDMCLYDNKMVSYATLSKEAARHSITLTAPSKTFNIAGLASAITIIRNGVLRRKWATISEAYELNAGDFLGYVALTAAFEKGEEWRQEMLAYLEGNVDFAMSYFEKNIPQIKAWRPEASFLMWLDCKSLGLSDDDLMSFFVKKAKLGLSPGMMFGEEGSSFMRMNFAVPRSVLEKALEQLKNAFL